MSDEIKNRTVYFLRRTDKEDDGTDIYVGSTLKPLGKRFAIHRCDATRPGNENNRLYKRMREVGLGNWEILPLLSRTCDLRTIREVERKWLGVIQADLNTLSPITSKEEKNGNQVIYCRINVQAKRYYCGVCEISCESKRDLGRHFDTLKHSYTWLNSVD